MAFLLNPRVLIALALTGLLAFTHLTAYRKGKQEVRNEWNVSIAEANQEAQRLERARQSAADAAYHAAATREAGIRLDADRARRESAGLRDDLDAIQRASAQSLDSAKHAVRALSDVFEQCSREYSSVAEEADRATSEVKMLREAWPQ